MDAHNFKQSLDDLMVTFYERMDSFEGKLQKTPLNTNNDTLAAEFASFKLFVTNSLRALQKQIQWLARETDQLEMQGRRKILLFHGLQETSNENTTAAVVKVVMDKLKLDSFTVDDISRCHRMGRASGPDKPRPVLCKIRDVALRDKIWGAKSCLKGTGTTISEFLTKSRHTVFMAARQRFGITKCWTRAGYIFVLGPAGDRHRVISQADLDEIPTEDPKASAAVVKKAAVPPKQKKGGRK